MLVNTPLKESKEYLKFSKEKKSKEISKMENE